MMKVKRQVQEGGSPQMTLEVEGRGTLGLWWEGVPEWDMGKIGCVGAFDVSDRAASMALLEEAGQLLKDQGCEVVIGPMDGNTWRYHRLVTDGSGQPPFFLEPANPSEWPKWWEEAGFRVLSRYSSSRFRLGDSAAGLERVEKRLRGKGVLIRRLKVGEFEDELRRIHQVCLAAFANNFLYTPLLEDEFVSMYGKVESLMEEGFAWVAEVDGEACGFVFGLPDMLALQRGESADFIVKTLAVLPDRRMAGLGSVLVDRVQQAAASAGFSHAIHALQHEANSSLRITRRNGGSVMRRYALYSKSLS